jgi:hypothetical protein
VFCCLDGDNWVAAELQDMDRDGASQRQRTAMFHLCSMENMAADGSGS